MMRTVNRITLLVLAFTFLVGLSLAPAVGAQTGTTITCDPDLILNLYVADRFFGFSSVHDQLMQGSADTSTMLDLTTIDRGQFTPLFDEFMGTTVTSTGSSILNQDAITGISEFLSADEAGRQTMMQEGLPNNPNANSIFVPITPRTVEGEATECAMLRSELVSFFSAVAFQDARSGFALGHASTGTEMNGATESEPGAEVTPAEGMESTPSIEGQANTDMTATPSS
jgi:hypothetical protein